jgi:hypothetical protein
MPPLNKPLPLCESDLANLRESGLTDAIIRANHLRTGERGLEFPYRTLDGMVNGYCRTRLHKPYLDKKGKQVKYKAPYKSKSRSYLPVGSLEKLRTPGEPILLIEGEKKSQAVGQLGYTTIGIAGFWGWKEKGKEQLNSDLSAIDWTDREVFICLDYDKKKETRENARQAKNRLAKLLIKAGAAVVKSINIPPRRKEG